jgi:NAD(P)-dependent dehydrogenase (short-subunit alcohol dehydrogenase family)
MERSAGGRPHDGVVVLGGTAGIGWETAAQFAEQGDRVVLMGRDDGRGQDACARLRERVPEADVSFVRVDAVDPDQATRAAAEAYDKLGSVEVLVCSSGTGNLPVLLHKMPIGSIATQVSEILLPPLHLAHAVLPRMRAAGRGSVILVASDAAKVATPGESVIGAAMAGIAMFARTAAVECKREGVRVNVLTPSLVADTPGAARIDTDPFSSKLFAKAVQSAQLGVTTSADLAALALYLASPAAERLTGQVISINGGISVA